MLKFVYRMIRFSGEYANRLKLSFLLSFLDGILLTIPILAIWLVIDRILEGRLAAGDALTVFLVFVGTSFIRMFLRYWFVYLESGTGYEICERERLNLGDRLRQFPMSFFSEGNLGRVSSVITVDLPFIEEMGMDGLDKVVGGVATTLIGCAMLLLIDWRIGALTICIFVLAYGCFLQLEEISKKKAPVRQRQQSLLIGTILEYIQGISVIKSFNLTGEKAKSVKNAIESTKDQAIDYEVSLLKPVILFKLCFGLGTALTVLMAAVLAMWGQMSTSMAIAIIIFTFSIYTPATAFASLSSQLRVMEAGLDRYEKLRKISRMDEGSGGLPGTYDVEFEKVTFSYEDETILEDVSFCARQGKVMALVGPSGGGKTTIANLILRFWDVQTGRVLIGGEDIRKMKNAQRLSLVSMVFQNVYLFNDTIGNNICFGNPKADEEAVIAAAKKAHCHDFIMNLPQGYDTVVGEGGSRLSGGERQRVSIARAILKDAPIIILDEATASVDPDNEGDIQRAIGALIKNKTLIIIAHRLSTIKNADTILVVENKGIVESGTHEELLQNGGRYAELWNRREKASGWRIRNNAVKH